jgi:hypothetical protein
MTNQPKETDDELLRRIEMALATVDVCNRNIKAAKLELLERREKEIQALLKAKDEPFGDVSIVVGNHKVKVNVPKKVTWDQGQLAAKHAEIVSSGSDPLVYMAVEYSVSETAFKAWPDDVRDYFKAARTVTPGNPSVKIEKEKE